VDLIRPARIRAAHPQLNQTDSLTLLNLRHRRTKTVTVAGSYSLASFAQPSGRITLVTQAPFAKRVRI
jgi:hypothetical protein